MSDETIRLFLRWLGPGFVRWLGPNSPLGPMLATICCGMFLGSLWGGTIVGALFIVDRTFAYLFGVSP